MSVSSGKVPVHPCLLYSKSTQEYFFPLNTRMQKISKLMGYPCLQFNFLCEYFSSKYVLLLLGYKILCSKHCMLFLHINVDLDLFNKNASSTDWFNFIFHDFFHLTHKFLCYEKILCVILYISHFANLRHINHQ